MTSNSKSRHRADKKKTTENTRNETIVFQKNWCQIQTYTHLLEQNNDHMWIMDKIKFLKIFKEA